MYKYYKIGVIFCWIFIVCYMEKICTTLCIIAGTVFLVIALLGLWRHFFTMSICYATAVLVSEDKRSD